MKFLLNRFTIKTDLIFTFSMIVVIMLIMLAISLNRKVTTDRANKLFVESIKVKNFIYKIERDEHKFRRYIDSKHIKDFQKHFYRLMKQIEILNNNFHNFGNSDKTIKELKKRLVEYKRGFKDFIKRDMEIKNDHGVLYYLNVIKNDFIIKSRDIKKYNFANDILILELIVKNYIISHNLKYSDKFGRYYENIKYKIKKFNSTNFRNRDELIFHLDEYKRYFVKLVEVSTIIGQSQEDGIIGDMRVEIYKAHEQIDILIKRSEKIRGKKLKQINLSSDIANIGLSIFLILISLLFFKRILNSIKEFEEISKKLASKKHNIDQKIHFHDETSFNKVAENINIFISNTSNIIVTQKTLLDNSEIEIKNLKSEIEKLKTSSDILDKLLSVNALISKDIEIEMKTILSKIREYRLITSINNDSERGKEIIGLIKESVSTIETSSKHGSINFKLLYEQIRENDNQKINHLAKVGESLTTIEQNIISSSSENISISTILKTIYKDVESWSMNIDDKEDIMKNLNLTLIENVNNSISISTHTLNLENKFQHLSDSCNAIISKIIKTEKMIKDWNLKLEILFKNMKEVKNINSKHKDLSINSSNIILKIDEFHNKMTAELNLINSSK